MENEASMNFGFTQVRTVRTLSAVIAFMGMVLLLIQRVLAAVLVMAQDALGLAFARYNNFTGRFAAQNFAEDKKLLALLKDVQGIVPMAETAVTVLLVVSIVLLVVALIGLAFPKQFSHVLVALKLLKWETGDGSCDDGMAGALTKLGNVPLKKLAVPGAIVVVVAVVVAVIVSCVGKADAAVREVAIGEMQEQALGYIQAQRSYFASQKKIGGPKSLKLAESSQTEYFEYKVSGTRFTATSLKDLGKCPAGSKWSVSASTKGFLTQELVLARTVPQNEACVELSPEFKKLGRK